MRALIESNLNLCRVPTQDFALVTADVLSFLQKAVKQDRAAWDLIFFDPPYDDDYLTVLEALGNDAQHLLAGERSACGRTSPQEKLLPDVSGRS